MGGQVSARIEKSKATIYFILFYFILFTLPTIKVPATARALSKVICSAQNGGNVDDLFSILSFSCAKPLTALRWELIFFGVMVSSAA
jgi:hypothetical protein